MLKWLSGFALKILPLIGKFTTDGETPLHIAARWGHVEMAEWLCSKDPSLIGKFTTNGQTPLHSAVSWTNNEEMAEWLYSKDPSLIGKFTTDGKPPFI